VCKAFKTGQRISGKPHIAESAKLCYVSCTAFTEALQLCQAPLCSYQRNCVHDSARLFEQEVLRVAVTEWP